MRIGVLTSIATAIAISAVVISGGGGGGPVGGSTTWTTANLWVDGTGGSCTRKSPLAVYVDAQACSSMQAAMSAAQAGDQIVVKCGAYSSQTISSGTKASTVTFYAESYDQAVTALDVWTATSCVTVGDLGLQGVDRIHIYGIQATPQPWNGSARADSALLQYQNGGDLSICNTGCTGFTTQDILIDGFKGGSAFMRATNVTLSHVNFGGFDGCYINSSTHVTGQNPERDNVRFWDGTGGSDTPTNDVLEYSLVHDQPDGVNGSEAASVCTLGSQIGPHLDCMQNNGGINITVRGNIFWNCPTSNFQWNFFSGATMPGPILIENNVFMSASCCNTSGVLGGPGNNGSGYTFRNNIATASLNGNGTSSGSEIMDGNIFLGASSSCGTPMTYTNNIFATAWTTTCGSGATKCNPTFTNSFSTGVTFPNSTVPNVHLSSTDTCAKSHAAPSFPAIDMDQEARPQNTADAGPDEIP